MKKSSYNNRFQSLVNYILCLTIAGSLHAQVNSDQGVVETYTKADRVRSGIAIGGLGTGSMELRKDGQFYNWSIMNNWPLGTGEPLVIKSYPRNYSEQSILFFLVRYQVEGEPPKIKLLQLNNSLSEGALEGIDYYYPWMSAVDRIQYSACFPFTRMTFSDPEMPFDIHMQAFSPFIPHDAKNSSLPGAYFNFTVEATGEKDVRIFLVASLRNLVGYDVIDKHFVSHAHEGAGYKGFSMTCGGMDPDHSSMGEMGIFSLSDQSSYYLGWEHKHPYYEKLLVSDRFGNVDDTQGRNMEVDGQLLGRAQYGNNDQRCFSSVGVDQILSPGASFEHAFVFSWYFPNSYGGIIVEPDVGTSDYKTGVEQTRKLGHYYNNFFASNEEVGLYLMEHQNELTERSFSFKEDFYNSSLPRYVLDQVNSQFNTFITSSIFTQRGTFAIREGMTPHKPWGPYGTIDVSLYGSSSIIALFPDLQKSMMHAHRRIQGPNGEIHHGLQADVDLEHNGTFGVFDRIDLVPNYIQLVLRDFFWTGDRDYLESMWPSITRGMDYILADRDEDHDMMPDMDGIMCSYDNFPMYGLASYIQSQWMASMASVKKAAKVMEDQETYKLADEILKKGTILMNEKLWNGDYFMLSNDYMGDRGADDAILTDQLVGQWIAHQSNLGYLVDEEKVKSALASVMDHSFQDGFGLRNCTWPAHPELYPIHETNLWVDQANTCWTGVELAFGSLLIYEGMVDQGEKVIKTVDERYRKAGLYWDHQEFGGHYYRPMSAWSILHAYLGLGISDGTYSFNPKITQPTYSLFFAHGNGNAHFIKSADGFSIKVRSGIMKVGSLQLKDEDFSSKRPLVLVNGKEVEARVKSKNGFVSITLPGTMDLSTGDVLSIKF